LASQDVGDNMQKAMENTVKIFERISKDSNKEMVASL
jgi:hypothetical protein